MVVINEEILKSKNFKKMLEDESNKEMYLNYLIEPNENSVMELNDAYKSFERQLMAMKYLHKAIGFEAKRFDAKIRKINSQQRSIESNWEDGINVGDTLEDFEAGKSFETIHNQSLEDVISNAELFQAIFQLSNKQRNVLHYRYVLELSEKEIALKMGVSQQAISKTHKNAIKKLREALGLSGGK